MRRISCLHEREHTPGVKARICGGSRCRVKPGLPRSNGNGKSKSNGKSNGKSKIRWFFAPLRMTSFEVSAGGNRQRERQVQKRGVEILRPTLRQVHACEGRGTRVVVVVYRSTVVRSTTLRTDAHLSDDKLSRRWGTRFVVLRLRRRMKCWGSGEAKTPRSDVRFACVDHGVPGLVVLHPHLRGETHSTSSGQVVGHPVLWWEKRTDNCKCKSRSSACGEG